MYGSVRRQLMQVYVQKSISTTRPRRPFICSGVVLNQRPGSAKSGAAPSTGSCGVRTPGSAASPAVAFWIAATASASNFGLPRRPASSSLTAAVFSRPPVGLVRKEGKWLASASWKRRSTLVNMSTAVSSITAPKPRCSPPPRPRLRTRSITPAAAEREPEQHDRRAEPVGDRHRDDLRGRAR